MSRNSVNLASYADVLTQLQAARELSGARLRFEDHKSAVIWRARAYRYRKLLRDAEHARLGNIQGLIPTTPWDDMTLRFATTSADETVMLVLFGFRLTATVEPLTEDDRAGLTAVEPDVPALVAEENLLPVESEEDIMARAAQLLSPDK